MMKCIRSSWGVLGLMCFLFTMVFGGLIMAKAQDSYTTVIPPVFTETVNVGEDFPDTVVSDGSAIAVENPCNFGAAPGLQVNTTFRVDFEGAKGGKGVMVYIKAPDNETDTRVAIYLIKNTFKQQYQYGYTSWFTLVDGDKSWTERTIDNYGPTLPTGFEGYLYIPYENITYPEEITDEDLINGMQVWFTPDNNGDFIMSAPIIVMGDNLVDGKPSTDKVIVDGEPTDLFESDDPGTPPTEPTVPSPEPGETPDFTMVVPPKYVSYQSGQASDVTVNVGEAFPNTVIARGTATAVENPCNFGTAPGIKAAGGFDVNILGAKGGVGVMIYVKAPDNENETRLKTYLIKNIYTGQYQYGYADWYTLNKGDSNWESQRIDQYGPMLPAKFEGYIYIPFSAITLTGASEVQPISDDDVITGMQVWFVHNDQDEFIMSAPIIVSPHGLKNDLPTTDKLIVDSKEVELFAGMGGDDPGDEPGNEDPGDEDELPEINYGNLDITEIKTPNLKGDFLNSFKKEGFDDWNELNSSEKVKSLVGIGPYSSIKIEKETGAVDENNDLLCSFYPDTSESDGGECLMGYIKMPEDSEATIMKWLLNFVDSHGRSIPAFVYNGACYMMARGETEWTQVPINAYYFDLPAGFDGYIRFDYKTLYSPNLETDGVPSDYKLSTVHLYVPNTTGAPIYVHPTMLITHLGDSKNGAYINGNKRAALNIFTGEVLQKDDLVTPLKIGDILKNLPAPTTDKMINDWSEDDVTTSTAYLSWEAYEGADSYRVDIFKKITGAEGLEFLYADTRIAESNSITLTGLTANTRYAVMVTALDSEGEELAIYDYCNLQTPLEDSDDVTDPTTEDPDDDDDVKTGYSNSNVLNAIMTFIAAGALIVLLTYKKKAV